MSFSLPCFSEVSFIKPLDSVTSAWIEHGPFAFWLMQSLHPRIFVELGTHNGFSYFCFCQSIKEAGLATKAYAIDTWIGDEHAGFYGEDVYSTVSNINNFKYSSFSKLIRSRFDEALEYFSDGSIDLLHIDGRHRYEDVKYDFETWFPKLSDRAIVIFHDTDVREGDFGVWKFWEEISTKYPSFEFIHCHGLGILAVGDNIPDSVNDLFKLNSFQIEQVKKGYSSLGKNIKDDFDMNQLLSLYQKKLEEAELSINQLQFLCASLETQIVDYQKQVNSFENSTSWKITFPFRMIKGNFWRRWR